jgi:hypothetical protein
MGSRTIKIAALQFLAAVLLSFSGGLLTSAPQAAAQSFGAMGMTDLEAARDSFFQSADNDGDFALSSEEQLSAMGTGHSALFECWDEDGDGLCSYAEFLDSGAKVFSELDVDGDGRLTAEEVQ